MSLPEPRRIKRTRYFTSDGQRCKKSTPGAIAKTVLSEDWYADIAPVESATERIERRKAGRPAPRRKRVRLCSNKTASQEMLRTIVQRQEKQAAGLVDFQAYANQPLGPMVEEFERHLIAIGRTTEYVDTTLARLLAVLGGCQFLRLVDIDCTLVEQWLLEKRTTGSGNRPAKIKGQASTFAEIAEQFGVSLNTVTNWRHRGAPIVAREKNDLAAIARWQAEHFKSSAIGTTTSDHYVTVLKRFGNWIVKPGRKADQNPFADLEKLNDETEIRKQRRVLEPIEFSKLIEATTSNHRTFRGLDNIDRATIYLLAAYTGLRASEIGSLTFQSINFGDTPSVTVAAAYTKNSELAVQPLRADLAERLKLYLANRSPASLSITGSPELIWPGKWTDDGAEMIRIDLAAAGIPYTVDGKDYDFHALRHQFITGLARAGVSQRVAQQLARHSKPELTANVYTHLSINDTIADVERLAPIPAGYPQQSQKATGTDGELVLGTRMGTQGLLDRGISGDKRPINDRNKKSRSTRNNAGESAYSSRVTEGT